MALTAHPLHGGAAHAAPVATRDDSATSSGPGH